MTEAANISSSPSDEVKCSLPLDLISTFIMSASIVGIVLFVFVLKWEKNVFLHANLIRDMHIFINVLKDVSFPPTILFGCPQ